MEHKVEVPKEVVNMILASVLIGQRYPKEDPKKVVETLLDMFFEKKNKEDADED